MNSNSAELTISFSEHLPGEKWNHLVSDTCLSQKPGSQDKVALGIAPSVTNVV